MEPAARTRVTWLGHATALVEMDGTRLLTDPLLTRRVAHLRRRVPVPQVDAVDVVVVSHAHHDHLHLPSLRRVAGGAVVVAPRGTGALVAKAGPADVVEVEEGDRVEVGGVTVEAVPAAHRSGRGPHSGIRSEPLGHVVRGSSSVYFAGDTDLFDDMSSLEDIDLALLPIWGWGPTIGAGHLDPARAVDAVERIEPGTVLPIHWGTYAPEDGRRRPGWFDRPARELTARAAAAGQGATVRVVEPGTTIVSGTGATA